MALLSSRPRIFGSPWIRSQSQNSLHRRESIDVSGGVLETICFPAGLGHRQRDTERRICLPAAKDRTCEHGGRVVCQSSSLASQGAGVSRRARVLIPGEEGSASPYYQGWLEAQNNAYDESSNPSGCIQLGLAENKKELKILADELKTGMSKQANASVSTNIGLQEELHRQGIYMDIGGAVICEWQLSLDVLEHWLATHNTSPTPEQEEILGFKAIAGYPDVYHGLWLFRSVCANFMTEICRGSVQFNPDQMVATTGATAAIELLAFAVTDPGDAFLLLSPAYPGFDRDIGYRSQVSLIPVQTFSKDKFLATRDALEKAFNETEREGQTVKGILMTSPSNPTGTTYDREYLLMILEFIKEKNIHLICDEIYAGSDFAGPGFTSVAELVASPSIMTNNVHIVSGLSKVLGVPGFRVGWLYSWNEQVLDATRSLTRFSSISTHTQQLFVALLSDKEFIREYLYDNRRKLRERWHLVREGLVDAGVEFIESTCGLFCWVNLTTMFLSDIGGTEQQELDLWKRLLYDVGINITPGYSCHCNERGWFRLCFAFVDEKAILTALDRLREFAAAAEREKLSRAKYA